MVIVPRKSVHFYQVTSTVTGFGLRNKAGAYETGKLFAPTLNEATKFGKNFDGIPNTIMEVQVPNNVLNGAYKFGADGMNAISILSNQLNLRALAVNGDTCPTSFPGGRAYMPIGANGARPTKMASACWSGR